MRVRDEVDEAGRQHACVQLVKLHQLDQVVEAGLSAVQREVTGYRRLARVLHLRAEVMCHLMSTEATKGHRAVSCTSPDETDGQ